MTPVWRARVALRHGTTEWLQPGDTTPGHSWTPSRLRELILQGYVGPANQSAADLVALWCVAA